MLRSGSLSRSGRTRPGQWQFACSLNSSYSLYSLNSSAHKGRDIQAGDPTV